MITALAMFGGVTLIAAVIVFLDYLGRRQLRKKRQAAKRSPSAPSTAESRP